jgi:hypothetical protein
VWLQVERGVRTSVAAGKQGGGVGGVVTRQGSTLPWAVKEIDERREQVF